MALKVCLWVIIRSKGLQITMKQVEFPDINLYVIFQLPEWPFPANFYKWQHHALILTPHYPFFIFHSKLSSHEL